VHLVGFIVKKFVTIQHGHMYAKKNRPGSATRMSITLTIFAAHVDDESQGVPHTDWTPNPITRRTVSVPDLHVAFGWR